MSPCKLSQVVNLERRLDANEMFAICDAIEMTPVELAAYESRQPNSHEYEHKNCGGARRGVRM